MTDKSIKELALNVGRPVEKLLEQVREAGLPQRKADDIITTEQQDSLMNHVKKSQGSESQAGQITLKRKTTSTAKVASTSGKVARSIHLLSRIQNRSKQKHWRKPRLSNRPKLRLSRIQRKLLLLKLQKLA